MLVIIDGFPSCSYGYHILDTLTAQMECSVGKFLNEHLILVVFLLPCMQFDAIHFAHAQLKARKIDAVVFDLLLELMV